MILPGTIFSFSWRERESEREREQSHINIGSDGTLARAPVWIGPRRGPLNVFLGPPFSLKLQNEVQFTGKIFVDKNATQNLINF